MPGHIYRRPNHPRRNIYEVDPDERRPTQKSLSLLSSSTTFEHHPLLRRRCMTADDVLSQCTSCKKDNGIYSDQRPARNPKVLKKSEKVEIIDDDDLVREHGTQITGQSVVTCEDSYGIPSTPVDHQCITCSDKKPKEIKQKHTSFSDVRIQKRLTLNKKNKIKKPKKEAKKTKNKTRKLKKVNVLFNMLVWFAGEHPNVLELILISPLLVMVCYILFVEGGQLYSFKTNDTMKE